MVRLVIPALAACIVVLQTVFAQPPGNPQPPMPPPTAPPTAPMPQPPATAPPTAPMPQPPPVTAPPVTPMPQTPAPGTPPAGGQPMPVTPGPLPPAGTTPPMNPATPPGTQPPMNPATPPMNPATPPGTQPPMNPAAGAPQPMNPTPAAPAEPQWPKEVGGKDLATWLKDLRESPDGNVREHAVKAIPYFGLPAYRVPALKPLLAQLIRESDPGVRVNIIIFLGQYGADKPEEIRQIVEALNLLLGQTTRGSAVRLYGTRALVTYGHAAAPAVANVTDFVEDSAWETRQAAAYTLGRIARGPDPKEKEPRKPNAKAIDALCKRLLKEESTVVRFEIAQSLLLLGPPQYQPNVPGDYERVIKPHLEAVTKRLETEPDAATKVWLLMTQMTYDGRTYNDTTVAKIADQIHGKDMGGQIAALRALGLLGDKAKPAIGKMIEALHWSDPGMVVEAIFAIAALKTVAKDALPDLERLKNHPDNYIKQLAANAIDVITGKKK